MGKKRRKQAAARKVAAEKATAELSEEEHALLELAEEVDVRAKVADALKNCKG